MAAPSNPNRRPDIQAALKRAKPGDMLSLEALAIIWGTAKSRFVSVKNVMPGFPPPIPQGTSHVFPAKMALKAMLDYETRHDAAAKKNADRQAAILGNIPNGRAEAQAQSSIPARELAILSRLAAETEQRQRDQGQYIPAAEVARIAGDVFSGLSEFMAGLSNKIDPNGLLDPGLRAMVDKSGSEELLKFHRQMRELLNADADPGANRGQADRAGKARVRRPRG